MSDTIYCSEVSPSARGTGWSVGCCYSCHEDADEYDMPLMEGEWNGRPYSLCCEQYRRLMEHGLPEEAA